MGLRFCRKNKAGLLLPYTNLGLNFTLTCLHEEKTLSDLFLQAHLALYLTSVLLMRAVMGVHDSIPSLRELAVLTSAQQPDGLHTTYSYSVQVHSISSMPMKIGLCTS